MRKTNSQWTFLFKRQDIAIRKAMRDLHAQGFEITATAEELEDRIEEFVVAEEIL